MTMQTQAFNQLRGLLKEMFHFGDNDLDFGIYRITRLKRQFIEAFIDGDDESSLRTTVTRALGEIRNQQSDASRNWLSAFAANSGKRGAAAWEALAADPASSKAQETFAKLFVLADDDRERQRAEAQLKTFVETRELASDDLEARVYNHLLNFFELYYANGDFGYNTRATSAFKVPYEADYDGSDTLFHWKHKDSYYIKTGNGFHSVRFEVAGQWLELRLSDGGDEQAETSTRNNNKDSERKHYRLAGIEQVEDIDKDGKPLTLWQVRFALAAASTPKTEIYPQLWQQAFGGDADLAPYLHKKPGKDDAPPGKPLFNDLSGDYDKTDGGQVKGLGQLRLRFDKYIEELAKREEFAALGSNADARKEALEQDAIAQALWQIDSNLNKFYVGNDADYFIHKDLQGFLTREKARFIKQVVFSDLSALLHAGEDNLTVLIARAFNAVADTLIGFLAAIENFQKALFELKKKVVDTHYLVSVGKIPADFHERVFACKAQRAEWQEMFEVKVSKAAQLTDHPTLVIDTRLYRDSDPTFQDDLLGLPAFDHLDEQTDGLLINSENWQALNLLQEKFRGQIKCIYIDPPYNTGGDGFLYKDSFRHSSWASMIHDRLALAYPLLGKAGVLFASIDDKERTQLETQLRQIFGTGNRVEELIWARDTVSNNAPAYSTNHEYIEVFASSKATVEADQRMFREQRPGYTEVQNLVAEAAETYPSVKELEAKLDTLYKTHKDAHLQECQANGIPKSEAKRTDVWKGIYPYKFVEYRDKNGKWIDRGGAKGAEATPWVFREVEPSMPSGKQADDIRDSQSENYRFYQPSHPITNQPCKPPKRGWAFPRRSDSRRPSFESYNNDKRIVFKSDGNSIPQLKYFLHEVENVVSTSVIRQYASGENELFNLTGSTNSFPNIKPTGLISRIVSQTTEPGEWVLDFFAGSGTSGHAVIRSDQQRRFLLAEMGGYFDSILVPRIKRVMYSTQWKDGAPVSRGLTRHMVKVQALEQYEDTLDNLHAVWDASTLPPRIPVRYLFRPEENALSSSLDVARPFAQTMRVGKARTETPIDLMETWCYLQGYWTRSRRMYREFDRLYLALETTHGVLVVLRNVDPAEDDTANLKAILAHYADDDGVSRIHRLEVNFDTDLRRLDIETTLISADDFLRGAQWS